MAFDAGTIIAHLDLDDQDFDRKLRADVARIEEFEKRGGEIHLTADVRQSDLSRVRTAFASLDRQVTNDARSRGGVLSTLTGMFSNRQMPGFISSQAATGRRISQLLSTAPDSSQGHVSRILSAAGPGFGPLGAKGALIGSAIPLAGAALPALAGVGAVAGVGGLGAGVIGLGAKTLIGSKKDQGPLYAQAQDLMKTMQSVIQQGVQPMLAPLRQAFSQIPGLLRGLLPDLHQLFAGAATLIQPLLHGLTDIAHDILPGLGAAFRAVAPSIRPLLDGVGGLVKGLLPGLVSLLKAAHPAIVVFAQILGTLGRDLGSMFRIMGPAMAASARVLKAIFDVVGGLLPIIARLADVFARALAPVIGSFAVAIKALEPALIIVGRVLGDLAKAVLGDLAAAFIAVARLIGGISPALTILGRALGQVFSVLESAGLFGALSSALEQIAPLLARLINQLVRQLAPILPVLITLIAQVGTILIDLMAAGLETVITMVLSLITHCKWLVPVIALVVAGFYAVSIAAAVVEGVTGIGGILIAITLLVGAATLLYRHWDQVWGFIKSIARDAWEFLTHGWGQWLIPELTLIRVTVAFVASHWRQAWQDIENWAKNAWNFLTHGWGQVLIPGLTAIRLAVAFLTGSWKQKWDDIKQVGLDAWHFLHDDVLSPLANFMTKTLPHAFAVGVTGIKDAWQAIGDAVKGPTNWVIGNVINGLIRAFDWVSSKVGGPHINIVPMIGHQKGGLLPGYGGGDILPALLEPGETVVSKEHSQQLAGVFAAAGVPGYAAGGKAGQNPISSAWHAITGAVSGAWHKATDIAKATSAIATGNRVALTNALADMFPHGTGGAVADWAADLVDAPAQLLADAVKKLLSFGGGGLGGRGAEIAKYAMSFAGKIPYVWGGTAVPGGADCSGFTESIYNHFGISAPRTSEAQGSWVKRSPAEIGGLAFYHSPPGGPDPGHVAFVGFNGNVISQGGGLGPQIVPIHSMPLLFTGVPPGGAGYGPGNLRGLESIWGAAGGGGGNTAHIAAAIAMAESGGREVVQQGEPPGLTGYGLWQITPTSGIWNNGRFGNLLNDSNNARAAVYLWRNAGGFSPWATYNSGAYQRFMDGGGWLPPGPSMVLNATRRGEAVLNPGQSRAFIALGEAAEQFARSGGSSGPSGLMRDVHLTLPEGTTVAQALREISWLLRTTSQQGYTGVR